MSRIASLESGAKDAAATRNLSTGIDPATFKDEANQTTEDQIGLDKGQRRDVQRRLTGLGFDTKVTGQFDPIDPFRDHALAGRPRLSQERLPQQAAAQGAADRDRGGRADRQFRAMRNVLPSAAPAAAVAARRSTSNAQPQQRQYNPGPDPAGAGRFIGGVMGGMLR